MFAMPMSSSSTNPHNCLTKSLLKSHLLNKTYPKHPFKSYKLFHIPIYSQSPLLYPPFLFLITYYHFLAITCLFINYSVTYLYSLSPPILPPLRPHKNLSSMKERIFDCLIQLYPKHLEVSANKEVRKE